MAAASVAELLNAAQESAAACERCAGGLWKLILQDPDSNFEELTACVNLLLTVSQKSPHVDRCIKLFGLFASKAPPDSEVASAVVEELLQHSAGHLPAADKTVRYHACQLLQQLLSRLPEGLLVDEAVLDTLTEAMLERLEDKLPGIRAEAVRALCQLMNDEDPHDIVASITALLEGDKSKDVRIAVVQSLPLNTNTLPVLLHRARDISPMVRKTLVLRLKGLSIRVLSIEQRARIIQQLLQDRDASVAEAAARMLAHWLEQDCGGDPLQLLQLLDVETYTDAAACAVDSLISSNSIQPAATVQQQTPSSRLGVLSYVKAAAAAGPASSSAGGLVSLRVMCEQQGRLMEPHEALLWRCLCEWLQTDAISRGLAAAATGGARAAVQAAVAAERHEALEQVLPDTADQLMGLIMRHTAAGPPARFAAAQLLMVAAKCMEWTDVASRDSAAPFLQQLISLDPAQEPDQHGPDTAATAEDEPIGLQLAGNGGDGLFEAAVVQLVLALHGSGAGFMSAMLDGIAALAAAAGLLRKPAAASSSDSMFDEAEDHQHQQLQQHVAFTVDVADSSQVLQVLCYIRNMLQQLPIRQQGPQDIGAGASSISFTSLWELLLLLALKQDHALVRSKAVECLGLYALVAAPHNPSLLTSAVSLLGPLLAAEGSDTVRAAAVRALVDISLLYGPAAVDAVLRRPAGAAGTGAGAAAEGDYGAGERATEGLSVSTGGSVAGAMKGLLDLLLEQAEVLLAEAQAAGGGIGSKARGKRGGRSTARTRQAVEDSSLSAAAAELMAVVVESLAKLLLHQRAWLRHYPCHIPLSLAGDAAAGSSMAVAAGAPMQLPPDSQQQQSRLLQRALALLLQLQFHPATATVTQVCQCLSVFFDVFTAASESNRLQLAATCLHAARQALNVKSKKHPAPLLMKYVLQLLQQARLQREQAAGTAAPCTAGLATPLGESYVSVAHQMLAEVREVAPITVGAGNQPATFKPYLSALIKVVCELPLDFSGPSAPDSSLQDLELLQSMAHSLSVIITDTSLSKDVTALQEHLQSLADAAGHTQQLTEDAVDQLVLQVCRLSLQQLPPLPEALAQAAAAAAAAAAGGGSGGGGGAGSSGTAAGRRSRSGTAAGKAAGAAAPGRKRASAAAAKAASRRAAASSSSSSGASDDSSSGEASDGSSSSSDHEEAYGQAHAVPAGAGRKASAAGASRAGARRSAAAMPVDGSDSDTDGGAAADGNSAARPVCGAPGRAASEDGGSTGGSDGLDSDSDEDGRLPRRASAAAGVDAGKARVQGHKAAARVSGAQRQPLAPSNMVNRSGRQ